MPEIQKFPDLAITQLCITHKAAIDCMSYDRAEVTKKEQRRKDNVNIHSGKILEMLHGAGKVQKLTDKIGKDRMETADRIF